MCCKVGSILGTTLGERVNSLSIWTWFSLVGSEDGVGVVIETWGTKVRGRVIMGGEVGGVDGTNIIYEFRNFDGTIVGSGTGDGRTM